MLRFLALSITRTLRNMLHTWKQQFFTLLTISLSVLIFSFFYLIYHNVIHIGGELEYELRLIVYLEEDPVIPLQEEYKKKITRFSDVKQIIFVSREQAYKRFYTQLDKDSDILNDVPRDFLPPSIEIYPLHTLASLANMQAFSDYLRTLPGVTKVQYGKEWIERFYAFTRLVRLVVLLSGSLLVMTTTFTVAYTLRLTLLGRQQELELLRLLGATNSYIRTPFLLEGCIQGILGSSTALAALYIMYDRVMAQFANIQFFDLFPFSFFTWEPVLYIIGAASLLCTLGSFSSIRRVLHL